ncbi:protein kinase [Thermodesulfobacteriota bacterium]
MSEKAYKKDEMSFSFAGISIPKNIGRLAIIKKLGRGSMGVVVQGWDPFIERFVAVKIPLPADNILKKSEGKYNQAFFHEAQSAGRLTHPNIVSIYDADIYKKFCYLTMEYIDGATLKIYCDKAKLLPVNKIIDIVYNTCRALDYAHNQGVVHWDIKPSNIMLNRSEAVKVTDFSIARMSHNADALKTIVQDANTKISGTLTYMSPQHFIDQDKVDHRSDIFSLGCVLYELLTGTKAFQGNNAYNIMYKITHEEPISVLQLRPDLPEILDKIIKKALRKDSDQRYQSCMDFAYDLAVASRHLKRAKFKDTAENVSDYICNVRFFKNFNKAQINQILSASQVYRVPKDEIVVSEGEVDDTLFIILSGKVEVLKEKIRIDTIERGECFGEMAYLSGLPRVATIRAITDSILIKISAALMDRLPESIQILFLKSFAKTTVDRISKNHQLILKLLNR